MKNVKNKNIVIKIINIKIWVWKIDENNKNGIFLIYYQI